MSLSVGQIAQTQARSHIARSGATRSGYYTSILTYLEINFVTRIYELLGTLKVGLALNDQPNSASFSLPTTAALIPVAGNHITIGLGARQPNWPLAEPLFSGEVIRVRAFSPEPEANLDPWYEVECGDEMAVFDSYLVTKDYSGWSASDIGADLVSRAPSFKPSGIVTGLPVIADLLVICTKPSDVLRQVVSLMGGGGFYLKGKTLHLFDMNGEAGPQPAQLTDSTPTEDFQYEADWTQVRTRVTVIGGGAQLLSAVDIGSTSIPVDGTDWFPSTGGRVICGAQKLSYLGINEGGLGTVVGPGAAPSGALGTRIAGGTGLTAGAYNHAVTFVTGSGESLPSPIVSTVLSGVIDPPSSVPYPQYYSGGGSQAPGYYGYAYTFVTAAGETTPGPTVAYGPNNGDVIRVYDIGFGPSGTTARRLYRTQVNDPWGQLKLLATIADNGTSFYDDQWNDSTLGANAPTTNSAVGLRVDISGIPIGAASVTSRKIYRTAVNGSQLKLVATIADNTTTTTVDNVADGSLGANAPGSDTSGLSSTTGQVLAGATSLLIAGTGAFSAAGGWAIVNSQPIRYTGISGSSLIGIPTTGNGAITSTISYGAGINRAAELTGVPATGALSIQQTLKQGDLVSITAEVNDAAAQAALATLTGTDGVREYSISDSALTYAGCYAAGLADLAKFSEALITASWSGFDMNLRPGKLQSINRTKIGLNTTLLITKVDIAFTEDRRGRPPRRAVTASNVILAGLLDVVQVSQ